MRAPIGRWRARGLVAALVALLVAPAPLAAQGPAARTAPAAADELAALFLAGCVPFAGNAPRLRDWAIGQRLPVVPEPARSAFLLGAPGLVFDATTPAGKFVLVSSDDGLCSAVAAMARGPAAVAALEAGMRAGGLRFTLVAERDDKAAAALHYREYIAAADQRVWRVLAATTREEAGGRAMLTAGPAVVERR